MSGSGLRDRYARLRAEVDEAARKAGREPGSIAVVAVTKTQPVAALREAFDAGITDVGENYVQEAVAKFADLKETRLRKHFIGHVQTNKARALVDAFDLVQSVDRLDAARALARAAAARGKRLPVLLQVNVSPAERFGCPPAAAEALADAVRGEQSLELEGLMAIGPQTSDRGEVARAFDLARSLGEAIGARTLSFGMSADWREAVAAGSTMLRVGTSLFGPRPRKAELAATSKT